MSEVSNIKIQADYQQGIGNSVIDKLEKAYSEKDKQKLKEACEEFESIMLSTIFKQMQKSIPKGGLFKEGIADDIFNDMFVDEVSKNASKQGGIGLSKLLYDSMIKRLENEYKFKRNRKAGVIMPAYFFGFIVENKINSCKIYLKTHKNKIFLNHNFL